MTAEGKASMGPRSHERGNGGSAAVRPLPCLASMGPRSHERGNALWSFVLNPVTLLQWGRVLMNAETRHSLGGWHDTRIASMGPRSHERGNLQPAVRIKGKDLAFLTKVLSQCSNLGLGGRGFIAALNLAQI